MATAMMHPTAAPHRPSMDRSPSFDAPRSRPTTPFTATYDRPSSPYAHSQSQAQFHSHGYTHSRSNSNASNQSPYHQPFANGYFPPPMFAQHQHPHQPQQHLPAHQAWTTSAIPASAFYPAPPVQFQYPGQVFHHGFQQSQADFQAWANAYQHMILASNGASGQGSMTPPPPPPMGEYDRRRTSSGPADAQHGGSYFEQRSQAQQDAPSPSVPVPRAQSPPVSQQRPQQQQQGGFHPYKRNGPSHKPSRENMSAAASASASSPTVSTSFPRSQSHPVLPSPDSRTPSPASNRSASNPAPTAHSRTLSLDSPANAVPLPPRRSEAGEPTARGSFSSDRSRERESRPEAPAPPRSASPKPTSKPSTPLHPGPIASATNTARPSPLSQSSAPAPSPEKAKGFKNRFKKALGDKPSKASTQVGSTPVKSAVTPQTFSPSETSTRSATPPTTPPQDLPAPQRPFAVSHMQALGSEVSLADTERTATTPAPEQGKGKGRSLFRMRNMSTDNISLSSTVSSASMMIRKMGSLGKIARRNSLMGISRIFKEKPKDEDGPLPEKQAKKKDKKKSKSNKGEPVPAAVSHATVEAQEPSDDRTLAGLSPAAKLARQHTLRSRAEAARLEAEKRAQSTGEPTWDNNTVNRPPQHLPSISSVVSEQTSAPNSAPSPSSGPEVVRVTPRTTSTVVHAVAVSEAEYDSEDDSSEGETVEDLTVHMAKHKLSDEADREFMNTWGQAVIDRSAVPKKGILKSVASFQDMTASMSRQRSNSTAETSSSASVIGPLGHPQADPDLIDGLHHPTPQAEHLEFTFDSSPDFDQKLSFAPAVHVASPSPYANPQMNTSAPALSVMGRPHQGAGVRSMTVPAGPKRRIIWAPECAVYSTYDAGTYDRRSEPATCNRLTPELALAIKQELNAFKLEMPVHPASRVYTHYFA